MEKRERAKPKKNMANGSKAAEDREKAKDFPGSLLPTAKRTEKAASTLKKTPEKVVKARCKGVEEEQRQR